MYQYRILSSVPLKLLNNGGSPHIIQDDGDTPELKIGDGHSVESAQGWGFDLSIYRQVNWED